MYFEIDSYQVCDLGLTQFGRKATTVGFVHVFTIVKDEPQMVSSDAASLLF